MNKEQHSEVKAELALTLASLEGKKESEGITVLQEMKEQGELDDWHEERFDQLCRDLAIDQELMEIKEVAHTVGDEALVQRIEKIETLYTQDRQERKQVLDDVDKLKRVFGKKGEEHLLDWATVTKEVAAIPKQLTILEQTLRRETTTDIDHLKETLIERTNGLNKRIDDSLSSLNRVHTTFRIILIVIGAVFSALTGTFIGVLIHFIKTIG
ncbi:MAG: hypothetical protein U9O98_10270 [Asgard group archaeon]|nr:hypothetical protein [Asgard group archaeon]